jgi:hypothetical protein
LPATLVGPHYVFVQTDAAASTLETRGRVFEAGNEGNNVTASPNPVLIELPPPSDLVVDSISAPPNAAKAWAVFGNTGSTAIA